MRKDVARLRLDRARFEAPVGVIACNSRTSLSSKPASTPGCALTTSFCGGPNVAVADRNAPDDEGPRQREALRPCGSRRPRRRCVIRLRAGRAGSDFPIRSSPGNASRAKGVVDDDRAKGRDVVTRLEPSPAGDGQTEHVSRKLVRDLGELRVDGPPVEVIPPIDVLKS